MTIYLLLLAASPSGWITEDPSMMERCLLARPTSVDPESPTLVLTQYTKLNHTNYQPVYMEEQQPIYFVHSLYGKSLIKWHHGASLTILWIVGRGVYDFERGRDATFVPQTFCARQNCRMYAMKKRLLKTLHAEQ